MATKIRNSDGSFTPTIVKDLYLGSIANVDAGAGKNVRVLMSKNKEPKMADAAAPKKNISDILAQLSDPADIQAILDAIAGGPGAAPKAAPVVAAAPPAEAKKPEAPVAAVASQAPCAPAVSKSSDEIMKRLTDAETSNSALMKRIAAMEEADEVKEFTSIAKSMPYAAPLMKTDEFANILRKQSKILSKEEFAKVLASHKSMNTALSQSEIFKNVGGGPVGDVHADAFSKLDMIANEIVSKSAGTNSPIEKFQAFRKACKDNPSLFAEYNRQAQRTAKRSDETSED
jgi:hypothetical protein